MVTLEMWGQSTIFLYRGKLSFLTLETCDFYAREIIICYSQNVRSVYNLFIPMKIIIPYSRNVWLLCTRNNYLLLSKCEVSLQSFYTDENYHSLLSKTCDFYAREIIIGYSRNVRSVYNLFIPMKIIIPYSRNVWLLCTRNNYLLLSKCEVSLQSFYTDEKLSFLTLETCDFYAREIIICYSRNVRSVYNLFIPMKIIIPYSRNVWLLCTRNNYWLLSKCEVSLQSFYTEENNHSLLSKRVTFMHEK